jgi:hypothetical protein
MVYIMLSKNQKRIQENLHIYELEKEERMKSFRYRAKLYCYVIKKKIMKVIM